MRTKNRRPSVSHSVTVKFTEQDSLPQQVPLLHRKQNPPAEVKPQMIACMKREASLPPEERFSSHDSVKILMDFVNMCVGDRCSWNDRQDVAHDVYRTVVAEFDLMLAQAKGNPGKLHFKVSDRVGNRLRILYREQKKMCSLENLESEDDGTEATGLDLCVQALPFSDDLAELKEQVATHPEHGSLLARIIELLGEGFDIREIARLLGFSVKKFYGTFRQLIARAWNLLHPEANR